MTYIGSDYHKKWTQAAAIDDQGKMIPEMRVLNDTKDLYGTAQLEEKFNATDTKLIGGS